MQAGGESNTPDEQDVQSYNCRAGIQAGGDSDTPDEQGVQKGITVDD